MDTKYTPNSHVFWQWDSEYRGEELGYARAGYTIGNAGCALCCLCSWLSWRWKFRANISIILQILRTNDLLIGQSGALLDWFGLAEVWPEATFDHSCWRNWRTRPANLLLLERWLRNGPVIIEVDFRPVTTRVDQHFVVAVDWVDVSVAMCKRQLWIMDPWVGQIVKLSDAYYNPRWDKSTVTRRHGRVARTITGARAVGHVGEED